MVLGGPEETGRLLEHEFDYIFFTGEGGPGWCPGVLTSPLVPSTETYVLLCPAGQCVLPLTMSYPHPSPPRPVQ